MTTINYRGTMIMKCHISDVETSLLNKGLNIDVLFGDDDYCYVSDGFLTGLAKEENESGEWHHYFTKEGAIFNANKMYFNN